jgi:hypothetical protein
MMMTLGLTKAKKVLLLMVWHPGAGRIGAREPDPAKGSGSRDVAEKVT